MSRSRSCRRTFRRPAPPSPWRASARPVAAEAGDPRVNGRGNAAVYMEGEPGKVASDPTSWLDAPTVLAGARVDFDVVAGIHEQGDLHLEAACELGRLQHLARRVAL